MKLDRLNLRILKALQQDSSISNLRLAEDIGLSESACHGRVKKLQQEGYIKGYTAKLNLSKVRYAHFIVSVALKGQDARSNETFRKVIDNIAQITVCYKISGQYDYVLHFMCPDAADFNRISEDLLHQDIGIDRMQSQLIIDETKKFAGYPLDLLFSSE
jgi:DNA-binding Lrp family transcriptional regulator